jgi:hypothetical protein
MYIIYIYMYIIYIYMDILTYPNSYPHIISMSQKVTGFRRLHSMDGHHQPRARVGRPGDLGGSWLCLGILMD